MPRIFPVIRQGTPAPSGDGEVDVSFVDTAKAADLPTMVLSRPDTAAAADVLGPMTSAVADTARAAEVATADGVGAFPDTARGADVLRPTRIVVPPMADCYINEAAAGSNFGTATDLISQIDTALGGAEKHWLLLWDLTAITSSVYGTPSLAQFSIATVTTAVSASTASVAVRGHTSQPFVEGTATWTNSNSPAGNGIDSSTVSFPTVQAVQTFTVTSPAALLGKWVYLRCTGGSALGTAQENVASREHATTSFRPSLTLEWP